MSDQDALLDLGEAARFLKVSETSLRRWTNAGRLACVRVGRRRERRFRRADLLAFLEEQPVGAAWGAAREPGSGGPVLPRRTHLCGLYASERGRATLAARFLADGLGPGAVGYLVGPPSTRQTVLTELELAHPAVALHIAAGRLVLRDAGDLEFFEAACGEAARRGVRRMRLVGDMVWCLDQGMTRELIVAFEHTYDTVIAQRFPIESLCQYDLRRFSGPDVLAMLAVHPDTLRYPEAMLAC